MPQCDLTTIINLIDQYINDVDQPICEPVGYNNTCAGDLPTLQDILILLRDFAEELEAACANANYSYDVYVGAQTMPDTEFLVTAALGSSMPGFGNAYNITHSYTDVVVPANAPAGYKWVIEITTRGSTSAAVAADNYNLTLLRAIRHRTAVNGDQTGIAASIFSPDTQYMGPTFPIPSGANTFSTLIWDNIGQTAGSLINIDVILFYALQTGDPDVGGANRRQLLSSAIIWKLYLVKI